MNSSYIKHLPHRVDIRLIDGRNIIGQPEPYGDGWLYVTGRLYNLPPILINMLHVVSIQETTQ